VIVVRSTKVVAKLNASVGWGKLCAYQYAAAEGCTKRHYCAGNNANNLEAPARARVFLSLFLLNFVG
jgi:hypothetical protein